MIIDSICNKGIELRALGDVVEIYSNSIWFMYFPHFDVTKALLKAVQESDDQQLSERMLKIINNNPFIKLDKETKAILETLKSRTNEEKAEDSETVVAAN